MQHPIPVRVQLNHQTTYAYDRPVTLSPHLIRLRPAPHAPNFIQRYDLKIDPAGHELRWQQDPFANFQARVLFPEKTELLRIEVSMLLELQAINPFDFFLEDRATNFPFAYEAKMERNLGLYLTAPEKTQLLFNYAARPAIQQLLGGGTVDFVVGMAAQVASDIAYETRLEEGVQDARLTLEKQRGSCRDSAWLLIQLFRHFGLAARFVSGYLIQLAGGADLGPAAGGVGKDTVDLHAWCEVYLPGAGWLGLDATSGLLAGAGHLPLAAAPSPVGAAPVSGLASLATVDFSYDHSLRRL